MRCLKLILIFCIVTLLGCEKGPTITEHEQKVLTDVILTNSNEVTSLDPLDAFHAGHIILVHELFDTLIDPAFGGKPRPRLAKSWDINKDYTEFTFHLRSDAYFPMQIVGEGGPKKVTARDVKFSFKRLLAPGSHSMGLSHFLVIKGAKAFNAGKLEDISGIKVKDDHTITFFLERPVPDFINRLSMAYCSIVPKEFVEKIGKKFAKEPLGSGPYYLKKWAPNLEIVLEKNPNAWHIFSSNAPNRIVVKLFKNPMLAFDAFKKGYVDLLELDQTLAEYWQYAKKKYRAADFRTVQVKRPILWFFYFNCAHEPFNRPEIRRLVSCAVNQNKMNEVIPINARPATRWTPWQALGYAEPPFTGPHCPEKLDPNLFQQIHHPIKLICLNSSSSLKRAKLVKNELDKLGIQINIEALPFSALIQKLVSQDFDIIDIYWGPYYGSLANYYSPFVSFTFPPNGNNFGRCSSPRGDAIYQQALSTIDEAERLNLFYQFEQELNAVPPGIRSFYANGYVLVGKRIKDITLSPFGYREYEKILLNSTKK